MILFLRSGLGNQMFTYAFARALQENSNTHEPIYINDYMFRNDSQRNLSLQHLKLTKNIYFDKGIRKYWHVFKYVFRKKLICRNIESIESFKDWQAKGMYMPSSLYQYFNYDNPNNSIEKIVFGYFQNTKYFESIKDELINELVVDTKPSTQNADMRKKIENCNSVCVHIRRGDYLDSKWSFLNVCDYNYYITGMKHISDNTENPVFFVFSNSHDDIEWIKKNYDFSNYNVEYVDLNNPDYEELRLMYSCKHFVISNSTFSWWAAYLGKDTHKEVVMPSEWNLLDSGSESLYMPKWHIVNIIK